MTILKVSEIKGLIEEQGTNKIKVEVLVPRIFFNSSLEVQKRIISELATGSTAVDVVSHFMAAEQPQIEGSPNMYTQVRMVATLNITEEILEELEFAEIIFNRKTSNSYFLGKETLSISKLKELVEEDINSFVIEIYRSDFALDTSRMNGVFQELISEEIELKDIRYSVLTENIHEAYKIKVKVTIPTLREQVEEKYEQIAEMDALAKDPLNSSIELLERPLSTPEVFERFPVAEGKSTLFKFLVEIPYSTILELEPVYIDSTLKEFVFLSRNVKIEDFAMKPIGFNSETQSIIHLATGVLPRQ